MSDIYDYIIVGAGSAGCVLAERLSADPSARVLLLEAGGEAASLLTTMPKGFSKLALDPARAWRFTVDQPRYPSNTETETWIRGRGLGGSSSVNGMIYVRGHPEDYEDWKARGGTGWGWSDMKRAFRAIEDHELGDDGLRGVGGPVHITTQKFRYPLSHAMIEAGEQMGLPRREDLNSEEQEGVGYYLHNIRNGRRQSANVAFLKRARRRPNLTVVTDAIADKVTFDGKRASGVIAQIAGVRTQFQCRGEVIVSSGAIMSPVILQRSGIGPGEHLRSVGVDVLVDRPDVGSRMREHLAFALPHRLKGGERGNNYRFRDLGLVVSIVQYYLTRGGPLATGPFEVGAFVRSRPELTRPDVQLYLGATTTSGGAATLIQPVTTEREPGMTIYGQMLKLTSEGSVRITSGDPAGHIAIAPNWLSTPEDQRTIVDMIRIMRRYLSQPALAPFIGEELRPGRDVASDEDLLAVGRRFSTSGLHGVATCRMGADDEAVVDARLRVRGVEGLRVVDCSIMPNTISGNTNGPAMAVGWRASELIIEDRRAQGG